MCYTTEIKKGFFCESSIVHIRHTILEVIFARNNSITSQDSKTVNATTSNCPSLGDVPDLLAELLLKRFLLLITVLEY